MLFQLGYDKHYGGCPFSPINIFKLLKHDLDFLAIRGTHRDEMNALGYCISAPIFTGHLCLGQSTFAFLTSAGVSSVKRLDIVRTLLLGGVIGTRGLIWEANWAIR